MEYRTLGVTGTLVSELCLGTMTFGKETDADEAFRILDRYVESGGNFVDTADVYSAGVSEEYVGDWLAGRGNRDDIILGTKARFPMGDGPNQSGLSRAYLQRALEASLQRLQVDVVDLYQVHCWDPATPLIETLNVLDDFVRQGLVRHIGVSNFSGWQLQRAILLARYEDLAPVVTLQPQYNLLERGLEWELLPLCVDERIGMLPWSPLGGGWLTGKYRREQEPSGATRLGEDPERGVEAWGRRNTERTWRIVDAVTAIAEKRDVSPAQVALRWVTDRPAVTSTILGVRSVEQLEDNLGVVGWHLDPDERAELDEVSDPGLPDYPYGLLRDMTRDRAAAVRW